MSVCAGRPVGLWSLSSSSAPPAPLLEENYRAFFASETTRIWKCGVSSLCNSLLSPLTAPLNFSKMFPYRVFNYGHVFAYFLKLAFLLNVQCAHDQAAVFLWWCFCRWPFFLGYSSWGFCAASSFALLLHLNYFIIYFLNAFLILWFPLLWALLELVSHTNNPSQDASMANACPASADCVLSSHGAMCAPALVNFSPIVCYVYIEKKKG